jgi:hypothetical protein
MSNELIIIYFKFFSNICNYADYVNKLQVLELSQLGNWMLRIYLCQVWSNVANDFKTVFKPFLDKICSIYIISIITNIREKLKIYDNKNL